MGIHLRPAAEVQMVDSETQTESEFKADNISAVIQEEENPEHQNNSNGNQNLSSSSFSNPLPSSSENSRNSEPALKRPKETNPYRNEVMGDEGNPEFIYDLSSNKKVKIGVWPQRNILMVHIREYYKDGQGYDKPSQKGIALTVQQFRRLFESIQDIDEDVCEIQSRMCGGSLNGSFVSQSNNIGYGHQNY